MQIRVSKEKECKCKGCPTIFQPFMALENLDQEQLHPKIFEKLSRQAGLRPLQHDACTTFAKEKRGDATGWQSSKCTRQTQACCKHLSRCQMRTEEMSTDVEREMMSKIGRESQRKMSG